MSTIDASIHERITAEFIAENPVEIVLWRSARTATNEGGWVKSAPSALPPQTGRLVQSGRIGASDIRNLPDGRIVTVEATIVLPLDADVQPGDTTEIAGVTWEVAQISGRWAVDAGVFRHAP